MHFNGLRILLSDLAHLDVSVQRDSIECFLQRLCVYLLQFASRRLLLGTVPALASFLDHDFHVSVDQMIVLVLVFVLFR